MNCYQQCDSTVVKSDDGANGNSSPPITFRSPQHRPEPPFIASLIMFGTRFGQSTPGPLSSPSYLDRPLDLLGRERLLEGLHEDSAVESGSVKAMLSDYQAENNSARVLQAESSSASSHLGTPLFNHIMTGFMDFQTPRVTQTPNVPHILCRVCGNSAMPTQQLLKSRGLQGELHSLLDVDYAPVSYECQKSLSDQELNPTTHSAQSRDQRAATITSWHANTLEIRDRNSVECSAGG